MKLVSTNCPNCGSPIKLEAGSKIAKCEYCGNEFMVDDGTVHIQYDNLENAGYEFEKGRQRAQQEYSAQAGNTYIPVETKKRHTFWWVMGWIFCFPIPLTILIARQKDMDPKIKYGLIAALWIIVLIIGYSQKGKEAEVKNSVSVRTEIGIETEMDIPRDVHFFYFY